MHPRINYFWSNQVKYYSATGHELYLYKILHTATHVMQQFFFGFTFFRIFLCPLPSLQAKQLVINYTYCYWYISICSQGMASKFDLSVQTELKVKMICSSFCCQNLVLQPRRHVLLKTCIAVIIQEYFLLCSKKIKNNISKNGKAQCEDYEFISCSHLRPAHLWDILSNSFPVHHTLIQDYMFLTSE